MHRPLSLAILVSPGVAAQAQTPPSADAILAKLATSSRFLPANSPPTKGGRQPLDAAAVPYIVLPQPSGTWDFRTAGIRLGACAAAIFNGRVVYGVFGDTGPKTIIGEASHAMAKALGINPDPRNGGLAEIAVTYVVFPGTRVSQVESPEAARACGEMHMQRLVSGG